MLSNALSVLLLALLCSVTARHNGGRTNIPQYLRGLWVSEKEYFYPASERKVYTTSANMFFDKPTGSTGKLYINIEINNHGQKTHRFVENGTISLFMYTHGINVLRVQNMTTPGVSATRYYRMGSIESMDREVGSCEFDKDYFPFAAYAMVDLKYAVNMSCPVHFMGFHGRENYIFRIKNPAPHKDSLMKMDDGVSGAWPHECCTNES